MNVWTERSGTARLDRGSGRGIGRDIGATDARAWDDTIVGRTMSCGVRLGCAPLGVFVGAAPRLGSAFFSLIGTLVNLNFRRGTQPSSHEVRSVTRHFRPERYERARVPAVAGGRGEGLGGEALLPLHGVPRARARPEESRGGTSVARSRCFPVCRFASRPVRDTSHAQMLLTHPRPSLTDVPRPYT